MNTAFVPAIPAQADDASATTSDVDVVCDSQGALCQVIYDLTDNESVAEVTSFVLGTPVKLVLIAVGALLLNRLVQRAVRRVAKRLGTVTAEHGDAVVTARSLERAEERASTIGSLLRSLSSVVIFGAALILMLEAFGVSLIPVIASAGVLAIAIGFGAQSVVEDVLRGLFMLAEDQFAVGDRVSVGAVNGYVERVTLRTTVIRDTQGTLWHVPNSEIDWVANEAQESSRATIEIGVAYTADLEAATEALQDAADAAADDPAWRDHVLRPAEVSGVQELTDDAVNMRVIVWVDAGERRRFERHLRRKLTEGLYAAGIEVPNRQVDVWMRGDLEAVV
jgi:small-conductance mechanosensitive channel